MNFNKMNRCILLLVLFTMPLFAQFDYGFDFSKAGTSGLQSLKIGVGARECAMGEAAGSVSFDANAVFWNLAGLAYVETPQVSFTQCNWLVNSKHYAAVVAWPFKSFVVALNAVSFTIDDFEETTVANPEGTGRMVSAYDIIFGLSVSKRFTDKLSIGGQVKFVQEKLDDVSANNVLFDIGTLYFTGFHQLRLGFILSHFGPDMKFIDQTFSTPLLFRISLADDFKITENYKLTLAAELVHPTDNNEWVNFGTEVLFYKMVALRAGYRMNRDEGEFTLGAGFKMQDFTFADFSLDYAYMPFGKIFGDIHRFSVGFAF